MELKDQSNFVMLLTGTAETYGKPISEAGQGVWWNALKHYDLADVTRAFSAHVSHPDDGRFMPKPADIVRHIDGSGENHGILAWQKVQDAISAYGAYESVCFDDPKIHSAIRTMGGWLDLCASVEEPKWLEKRFLEHYKAARIESAPRYLIGVHETGNRDNGFPCESPKLIGDVEKCMALIHNKQDQKQLVEGIG